jgi:hypothetical protein
MGLIGVVDSPATSTGNFDHGFQPQRTGRRNDSYSVTGEIPCWSSPLRVTLPCSVMVEDVCPSMTAGRTNAWMQALLGLAVSELPDPWQKNRRLGKRPFPDSTRPDRS